MGRKVSQKVQGEVWYAPDITAYDPDGKLWRNRSDEDPFKVLMTPLDAMALEQYESQASKFSRAESKELNFYDRNTDKRDRMIAEHVSKVVGYEIAGEGDATHVPKTGAELVSMLREYADGVEFMAVLSDIEEALVDHSVLRKGLRGE